MKNIHVLPTDKLSKLYVRNDVTPPFYSNFQGKPVNIYITSDEEIKEGDWFLPQGHINPHKLKEYNKINGDLESYNGLCYDISKCKKIILTTDQDLIKDGVQAIDDEFLEWFVKNPSCDFVMTIPDVRGLRDIFQPTGKDLYKIIIPKEEPKQETLDEVAERLLNLNELDSFRDYHYKQELLNTFKLGVKYQKEKQDTFAIEFAEWVLNQPFAILVDKELLEIFKNK